MLFLILNIVFDGRFIKHYCTNVTAFCPEIAVPKLILEIGILRALFPFKYPMKLKTLTLVKYSLIYVYDPASNDPRLFQLGSTPILTITFLCSSEIG